MKRFKLIAPVFCSLVLCLALTGTAGAGGYFAFTVSDSDWLPRYGQGATQQEAERAAIQACGGDQTCVNEVESAATPICFAVADAPERMGWASRVDYNEAIDAALEECRKNSNYCQIISVECRK
ncbi:MAG: DUF4189 domain-containing protein [Desulfovibrio sp.]|jgi:hypothetical protein|nr:DUF4189 domain-containing protein [Desulfovibrio sp.]